MHGPRRGYTHIDCAAAYANEAEVGHSLAAAMAKGTITRANLFVTSKLWQGLTCVTRRRQLSCTASGRRMRRVWWGTLVQYERTVRARRPALRRGTTAAAPTTSARGCNNL